MSLRLRGVMAKLNPLQELELREAREANKGARSFPIRGVLIVFVGAVLVAIFAERATPTAQMAAQSAAVVQVEKPKPKNLIDRSEAKQTARKKLIQKLINEGVFVKIEVPGSLPRVRVGPRFYALDFDTKQSFVSVVFAYHFDDADSWGNVVRVYDGRTNKEIGDFSPVNPGLKLY
jgi:hypothetical protein